MELPFAVESPERNNSNPHPLESSSAGNSLVTASSQGSFLDGSVSTAGDYGASLVTVNMASQTAAAHHSPVHSNQRQQQQPKFQPQQKHLPGRHPPHSAHRPHHDLPSAPAPAPTSTLSLNIFGKVRTALQPSKIASQPQQPAPPSSTATTHTDHIETVDFTYVNVSETDADDEVDISFDGQHQGGILGVSGSASNANNDENFGRGDILALLLSGTANESSNEAFVIQCEEANTAARRAMDAKTEGDLQGAVEAHVLAANMFRDAAISIKDRNDSIASSLLLLSQTQAKSALALKRVLKLQPTAQDESKNSNNSTSPGANDDNPRKQLTHKDRLRAAVRGALVTRKEEDISDSAFLGRATKGPVTATGDGSSRSHVQNTNNTRSAAPVAVSRDSGTSVSNGASQSSQNPVDDMMELERELRDMDMALELGNSIASLDARTQSRLKSSIDGSFMVVPPGSQSYMSSSNMWSTPTGASHPRTHPSVSKQGQPRTVPVSGTAGVRARANRVQNIAASGIRPANTAQQQHSAIHHPQQSQPHAVTDPNRIQSAGSSGLESSWWGTSSSASQMLASSVISLSNSRMMGSVGGDMGGGAGSNEPAANTKQLVRLMDALKTLGDENANLMRELEEVDAARLEAKTTKEQMAKFKAEYAKRFTALKEALEKFRKGYPEQHAVGSNMPNPVTNSEFIRSVSTSEQLQRQEQLIRKLTADLKKEKEESKKKDAALRKYESFYREVKARSAQKAAQRQKESGSPNTGSQRPPLQQPPGIPKRNVAR